MTAMLAWEDVVVFYNHLTLHLVPGPRSLSYFIPFALPIIALLIPSQLLSRRLIQWAVLPLTYAIQLQVWIYHRSFDVISANMALASFMLLGWYDVRSDFRYVRRSAPQKQPTQFVTRFSPDKQQQNSKRNSISSIEASQNEFVLEPYPTSFSHRLIWLGMLLSSMRLTDWRIGIHSHDRKQPMKVKNLASFAKETIAQALFAFVLLDFTVPYVKGMACKSDVSGMMEVTFVTRSAKAIILLLHFYAALSLALAFLPYLISIPALLLVPSLETNPMASPLTWPGLFGPLSSIYSTSPDLPAQNLGLRAFWGVFWHQNMRYTTSTPGVALASWLNLERGSRLRYIVIVASGFWWSGIVHMGVVPPEPLETTSTAWQLRFRLASFFWLQIIGIFFEDVLQGLVLPRQSEEAGPNRDQRSKDVLGESNSTSGSRLKDINSYWIKCIVVIWTVGFLAISVWWTALPVGCELGWFDMRLISISYVERYTAWRFLISE